MACSLYIAYRGVPRSAGSLCWQAPAAVDVVAEFHTEVIKVLLCFAQVIPVSESVLLHHSNLLLQNKHLQIMA